MVADRALTPATRLSLGELLPHQLADRMQTHLKAQKFYIQEHYVQVRPSSITPPFGELFLTLREVIYMLLTRLPLFQTRNYQPKFQESQTEPFDLHTLGTQPTFILSYDQTLIEKRLT